MQHLLIPYEESEPSTLRSVAPSLRAFAIFVVFLFTWLAVGARAAVTITGQPQPVTRVAGHYAFFSVQAAGTGTLSYQWRKNGSDIPDATQQGLMLNPISAGDAADYSVVVSDAEPSSATSASAMLTVRAPQPGDLDFSFGGPASMTTPGRLRCRAMGK